MDALVKLSRYYGNDPEFVLAGGGNTSVKIGGKLYIKGSGHPLSTIDASGFVALDRKSLSAILEQDLGNDATKREESFKALVLAARLEPDKGQRPSVESVLHNLMPRAFVVHTHCTPVNMITCSTRGQELAQQLFGDQIVWIAYTDPGFTLAKALSDGLKKFAKKTGRDCPLGVLMQSHGLVVCGDTPDEVRENTDRVVNTVRQHMAKLPQENPFGAVTRLDAPVARKLVLQVAPMLRGLLASGSDALKFVTFDDSDTVLSLVGAEKGKQVALGGPLCPDQIVSCKSMPMWFEPAVDEASPKLLERLRKAVDEYVSQYGFQPPVVLVKGLGLFGCGDNFGLAQNARLLYVDAIKVMAGAARLGEILYMTAAQRDFIEKWEVESYRRKVFKGAAAAGRAAGKIAIVTGAAQGFGLEIAQGIVAQAGTAVLTDMNVEGARKAASELTARAGEGRALGLAVNVTEGASIEEMLYQVVRTYGGFDVLVSNAGVLKAESVKTQPERDFDFVTSVNYKGYFLCVQKAAPILSLQHAARPDYWSDIIQINSKSGLQGSSRNGAYAGSKFGGVGLTQSFALELVEDGVKVNAICPGNFFDGPLWSDPQNGLFVQYLRSGKVPGAKTIADVKKFYEAKVPMGRGCETGDVLKAVFYLLDQKYETGQAVPVTGGQVMLS
jgi:rhamnose utilization protein RhaD (predicted bifunctional aldolase and dehydrogenase)/NAD(P)-dependent dehydrogenase (short-subunit alcohol dehydrogenase family)